MQTYTTRHQYQQWPHLPDPFAKSRWASNDLASVDDIYREADYVRSTCPNGMGWAVLGARASVGVALWQVGSIWDEYVESILPRITDALGNGTDTDAAISLISSQTENTNGMFETS